MKNFNLGKYLISVGVILVLILCLIIGFQIILWVVKLIIIGALIMAGAILTRKYFGNLKPK